MRLAEIEGSSEKLIATSCAPKESIYTTKYPFIGRKAIIVWYRQN